MDDTRPDLILADCPLAFVDVETTGASTSLGDRVVEIGLVRVEHGRIVHTQQQLLDPRRGMTSGASRVTGITSSMLIGAPLFEHAWPGFQSAMRGCVLVGHNVTFDMSFLDRECRALQTTLRDELACPVVLDTCRLARKLLGRGGNGLQRLAERFGINKPGAHRALADCLTTAALFEILIEPLGGWRVPLSAIVTRQGGSVPWPATQDATHARTARVFKSIVDGVETHVANHVTNHVANHVVNHVTNHVATHIAEDVADRLVAGRAVRIVYVDAKARQSDRTITPRYVRRVAGRLTLFAHCHERGADRQFIVEQILSISED